MARESGARPGLATILVGDDYAALAYERRLRRHAEAIGCTFVAERLPEDAELADVLATVGKLNADPRVTGILVLRPLPPQVPEVALYGILDPAKDIEAVHPANAGLMAHGLPRFVPSTPASCFYVLDHYARSQGAVARGLPHRPDRGDRRPLAQRRASPRSGWPSTAARR